MPCRWLLHLALALLVLAAWAPAQACSATGCVSAGPRLASVNSARGALLNALLGQLTNSSVNVSVADWNSVANGQVSLLKLANALQAQLGVSSTTQALNTPITLAQLATAAASAATGDGNNLLAASLAGVGTGLGTPSGTLRLGELLLISNGVSDTRLNALELISGAAQLYNARNVLTTPAPITLSGAAIGLGALIGTVQISAQVVEPPVYVCGPAGSSFHTATVRLKLLIDLVDISLDTSSLLAVAGVSTATVKLADLSLYVEVARADGTLSLVNTVSNALQVQVKPGVADLYLGTMADDSVFFNRSRPVQDSDFGNATIGSVRLTFLTLPLADVAIYARGAAHGQAPSTTLLSFTGPYPQTQTATTQAGFTTNLLSTLVNNLQISFSASLGLLDAVLQPLIRTIVRTGLLNTLGSVVSGLVDPLLELLGVRLGEVDVTAGGTTYSCSVSGSVYNDANHNAMLDGNEAGTGQTLYAKLVPTGSPSGPAQWLLAVDGSTGTYSFTGVPAGSYTLVINTSSSFANVAAAAPAGWVGTEAATLTRSLTISTADLGQQRFGLFRGSRLSGTVFKDTGNGGGTANNGLRDGAEAGIAGATLKLTDASGSTVIDTARSGEQGGYTLWLPHGAAGAVKVLQQASGDWVPVGGSAGNTAGAYTLASDSTAFVASSGNSYSGVNFAKVPASRLDTDGQQEVLPGQVAFYAHSYTAGTAGTLVFLTSTPPTPGWGVLLYEDLACNGQLDAGDVLMPASRSVVAGQRLCVLAKVSVPAEAAFGSQFPLALTARLAYANHTLVGEQQRQDLTTVGEGDALRLLKTVDKTSASIGELITYTISYRNAGTSPLSTLKIIDQTPAYTVFSSASCGSTPAGLSCSVSQQPAAGTPGRVEWTFTGTLASGAEGTVVLRVLLQ